MAQAARRSTVLVGIKTSTHGHASERTANYTSRKQQTGPLDPASSVASRSCAPDNYSSHSPKSTFMGLSEQELDDIVFDESDESGLCCQSSVQGREDTPSALLCSVPLRLFSTLRLLLCLRFAHCCSALCCSLPGGAELISR